MQTGAVPMQLPYSMKHLTIYTTMVYFNVAVYRMQRTGHLANGMHPSEDFGVIKMNNSLDDLIKLKQAHIKQDHSTCATMLQLPIQWVYTQLRLHPVDGCHVTNAEVAKYFRELGFIVTHDTQRLVTKYKDITFTDRWHIEIPDAK